MTGTQYRGARWGLILLCAVVPVSQPPPAFAEPEALDDSGWSLLTGDIPSVFSASKYDQKVTDAPSSVSIITAAEIEQYGWSTLTEILGAVRGFYTGSDHMKTHVGVRGVGPPEDLVTRILVLVDGQRLDDPIYAAPTLGAGLVNVDAIDRVEVIHGPTSALYGTNAFFGVVNVITKRGRDLQGGQVAAEVGVLGTYEGRVVVGEKLAMGLEYSMSGGLHYRSGQDYYFPYFDNGTSDGVARGVNDALGFNVATRLSYRQLSLGLRLTQSDKALPSASFLTVFGSDKTRLAGRNWAVDFAYQDRIGDIVDLSARVFYQRFEYEGRFAYQTASDSGDLVEVVNHHDATSDTIGLELKADMLIIPELRLTIGYELRHSPSLRQKNYDAEVYFDDERAQTDMGAYVQAEWAIIPELTLNLAGRLDWRETFGTVVSPRAAIIVRPTEGTVLKALAGTAFRAPNALELYYDNWAYRLGDVGSVDPERIRSLELAWDQTITTGLRSSVSVFYNDVDGLIELVLDMDTLLAGYQNARDVEVIGAEVQLDADFGGILSGALSYSIQRVEDRDTGERPVNSPVHLAKLRVAVPIFGRKLSVAAETSFMSERPTHAGTDTGMVFLTNLSVVSRDLVDGLLLRATVLNLFDLDYDDPASRLHYQPVIPRDGINVRFTASYTF